MQKLFFLTLAIGAGIGAIMPSAKTPPAAAAAGPRQPAVETMLEREGNGHFYADAEVNDGGDLVHFLVDTGSSFVALTVEDAERLGVSFTPENFDVVGMGASGPVRGELVTLDRVSVEGKEVHDVPAAVIEGLDVSLLGQSYLNRLDSVSMSGDQMILR